MCALGLTKYEAESEDKGVVCNLRRLGQGLSLLGFHHDPFLPVLNIFKLAGVHPGQVVCSRVVKGHPKEHLHLPQISRALAGSFDHPRPNCFSDPLKH